MSNHPVPPQPERPPPWIWLMLLILAGLLYLVTLGLQQDAAVPEVPYSELKALIRADAVGEVRLDADTITAVLRAPAPDQPRALRTIAPPQPDADLLPLLESHGVDVTAVARRDPFPLLYVLPWIILIAVYIWFVRRVTGGMRGRSSGADEIENGCSVRLNGECPRLTQANWPAANSGARPVSGSTATRHMRSAAGSLMVIR